MHPYRLRLPAVARLRTSVRDEKRQRVADALRAEQILVSQQEQLTEEMKTLLQEQRAALQDRTGDVNRVLASQRYEGVLRVKQQTLAENLSAIEHETKRRQQELTEAERDLRSLEQIELRGRERHTLAQQREEQRLMDEVASQRAARQRPSSADTALPLR